MNKNKMAFLPMNQLIFTMSLPVMISMFLMSIYNIVDSAFVANMDIGGEQGLHALTLCFPVHIFMIAIALGTGIGAGVMVSRNLGKNKKQKVSFASGNAIFLGIIISILYFLFAVFGVKPYISTQTNNSIVYDMAVDYLYICSVIPIGLVFFGIFEKLLQSTGRTMLSTIAQIVGAVINLILDPILIYGWVGFEEMGVKGAAYATIIGQCASALLTLIFYLKYCTEIDKKIKYLTPSFAIIKEIYRIGFPAIISQSLISIMSYGLNIIFAQISEGVVMVYGLYFRIQQIALMIIFGLRDAVTPIISFSYGMASKFRINQAIKYSLIYTTSIMIFFTLLFGCFAFEITAFFGLSQNNIDLCVSAIRIISLSFVFAGANIMLQGIYQALNSPIESLISSLSRQIVLILPLAYMFSKIAIANPAYTWSVWWTFVIAEIITFIISYILIKRLYIRKIANNTF